MIVLVWQVSDGYPQVVWFEIFRSIWFGSHKSDEGGQRGGERETSCPHGLAACSGHLGIQSTHQAGLRKESLPAWFRIHGSGEGSQKGRTKIQILFLIKHLHA